MTKKRFVVLSQIKDGADFVRFCELNGSYPGAITDLNFGTCSFCTADISNDPRDGYPLQVPHFGCTNRSFIKTIFLEVFDFRKLARALDCSKISNLFLFGSGHIAKTWDIDCGKGGKVIIGHRDNNENGLPLKRYVQATGTTGVSGDPLENHPYFKKQKQPYCDFDEYTVYSPYIIDRTIYKSNFKSKAAVMQVVLSDMAGFGEKPAEYSDWGCLVWGGKN